MMMEEDSYCPMTIPHRWKGIDHPFATPSHSRGINVTSRQWKWASCTQNEIIIHPFPPFFMQMDNEGEFVTFLTLIGLANARSRDNVRNSLVNTFRGLLQISESDIKNFVRETADRNRHLAANQQCTFASSHATSIRAMRFELRTRHLCDALPTAAEIAAIDANAITILRTEMVDALVAKENRDNSNAPDMTV